MTAKVIEALESIKDLQLFEDSSLTFIGGTALTSLHTFIENKTEPKDDESVYLDEYKPINLSFDEIKEETLISLKKMMEK